MSSSFSSAHLQIIGSHHHRPFPFPSLVYRSRDQRKKVTTVRWRTKCQAFQVVATSNPSSRKRGSDSKVIMVDPLEAKRLAAIQMQELQAREKLSKERQIEAYNGAWAMIGLTAGLVIEGGTGHNIIQQVEGYFISFIAFIKHIVPLRGIPW